MLACCNRRFSGGYYRVLSNKPDFYRRIEFGICPNCGQYRLLDFRMTEGKLQIRTFSGKNAESSFEKILKKLKQEKHGTKSNQNYHYGDFKMSGKKDYSGNPIYLQLRRNFNNEAEVLGEVETKTYNINQL
ncbi:hypothetical protein IKP85_05570 [bacterium]|nr:hypothetical protein [bacterium]